MLRRTRRRIPSPGAGALLVRQRECEGRWRVPRLLLALWRVQVWLAL